ncbi:histidine utilization repressor [Dongia mobilis]|jgi:GntR family histidine utilization transcriptional repressor|uniref:histidine utilization repressor n=1 Tax=Dongia sp. TaxID=1977262 RepID=UPI0026EFEAA1
MNQQLVPHYQRVKRMIADRIKAGTWNPGDRISSEAELVKALGVSRMTINRALRELTIEGTLTRVQGVGTFVAMAKPQAALFEVRNIAEEIAERGHQHRAEVLTLKAEPAPDDIAATFGLKPGSRVFHSVLLHRENELPVQLEDRYVDPRHAADYLQQDFTRQTPYVYLTAIAPISEAEHIIEAVLPSTSERKLLKIDAHEPCLQLTRRTWSAGKPVSHVRLIYPGSRYRLSGRIAPKRDI